jgi:hypothetical protein
VLTAKGENSVNWASARWQTEDERGMVGLMVASDNMNDKDRPGPLALSPSPSLCRRSDPTLKQEILGSQIANPGVG